MIDIDPHLLQSAQALAEQRGQPFSILVEQALRDSLLTAKQEPPGLLYGEPFTDEDMDEAARVAFRAIDQDEADSQTR